MFRSAMRTSRLGAGHNDQTPRFTPGPAACLGGCKQEWQGSAKTPHWCPCSFQRRSLCRADHSQEPAPPVARREGDPGHRNEPSAIACRGTWLSDGRGCRRWCGWDTRCHWVLLPRKQPLLLVHESVRRSGSSDLKAHRSLTEVISHSHREE